MGKKGNMKIFIRLRIQVKCRPIIFSGVRIHGSGVHKIPVASDDGFLSYRNLLPCKLHLLYSLFGHSVDYSVSGSSEQPLNPPIQHHSMAHWLMASLVTSLMTGSLASLQHMLVEGRNCWWVPPVLGSCGWRIRRGIWFCWHDGGVQTSAFIGFCGSIWR